MCSVRESHLMTVKLNLFRSGMTWATLKYQMETPIFYCIYRFIREYGIADLKNILTEIHVFFAEFKFGREITISFCFVPCISYPQRAFKQFSLNLLNVFYLIDESIFVDFTCAKNKCQGINSTTTQSFYWVARHWGIRKY